MPMRITLIKDLVPKIIRFLMDCADRDSLLNLSVLHTWRLGRLIRLTSIHVVAVLIASVSARNSTRKHNNATDFEKNISYCCIDQMKINLESYHKALKVSRLLLLIESIDWFSSFLKIDFTPNNTNLFKKTLQFKRIDSRVSTER